MNKDIVISILEKLGFIYNDDRYCNGGVTIVLQEDDSDDVISMSIKCYLINHRKIKESLAEYAFSYNSLPKSKWDFDFEGILSMHNFSDDVDTTYLEGAIQLILDNNDNNK